MDAQTKTPIQVAYERRNKDLDPQLVWRGKDVQDWSDLVVHAPPVYIQEKIHPKALIDDLRRQTEAGAAQQAGAVADLFADFNGLPEGAERTDFYQHDAHWSNRMILGDSLQVMASLAEREGLRGQVQCIYFDPPYGIKFNSNFQWSTTSRDVKDGNAEHITREPEQVKAFRDTWRDGIHSYLTYLRDRLTVARDLLTESGSIFVQIGEENVHRVRAVLDEVFGDTNFVSQINFKTTGGAGSPTGGTETLASVNNFILWYAKNGAAIKYRQPYRPKKDLGGGAAAYNKLDFFDASDRRTATEEERERIPVGARLYCVDNLTSQSSGGPQFFDVPFRGKVIPVGKSGWKTTVAGMVRLGQSQRLELAGQTLRYVRYVDDFPVYPLNNSWDDTVTAGFSSDKLYVVQTNPKVIERCILMATDPGDLVLDPTCGSGTTAYVAEQWGRRWITLDTSRVALALARARIMGARYPYYLLADSPEGQRKEAEVTRAAPSTRPTHGSIRQGFVYERVPHITLKSIANNAEIDVIWERFEAELKPLRERLSAALPVGWLARYRQQQKYTAPVPDTIQEWEIPREAPADWLDAAKTLLAEFWRLRIARQQEIDASIAAKAEFEYLYDRPYEDKKRVRVAGPFTVESLSPHRVLGVDENDELIDPAKQIAEPGGSYGQVRDFVSIILENLRTAGVQQAHKQDKIDFTALNPWPGDLVCAEGRYLEGETERRAAIFIGPEFGTVSRPDLVEAAREAADAGFDVLIACAFSFDAHAGEFSKLGRVPVLKARMNADLHMAEDLKNTGKGNLFVIFGEPDITLIEAADGQLQVRVNGVDVFDPSTGEVRSDGAEGIACWFIDTDYNQESFFVRHAYFLGAGDPYKALKTTLKAEIDADAWATLNSDTSRPFPKPKSGRIAVKVINHLGDEVMKVFRVSGDMQ
ncbi:site-specific DNA-methyltransferase [Aerosticca soli]|uniref:site-specific DNA-methyltransferase n=1 Tax=Aerosticca soli TaxID=2010829 RepID=UPI001E5C5EB1|nr:site-specific DNA-methyltransferase [Aerosticca soli]